MAQKYLHNFKRGACVTGNMKREAVKLMEERRWQGTCMIERIATLWNRDIIITLQRKTLETQTTVFTIFYVPSYRALVMYRTPRISVSEDLYEINWTVKWTWLVGWKCNADINTTKKTGPVHSLWCFLAVQLVFHLHEIPIFGEDELHQRGTRSANTINSTLIAVKAKKCHHSNVVIMILFLSPDVLPYMDLESWTIKGLAKSFSRLAFVVCCFLSKTSWRMW